MGVKKISKINDPVDSYLNQTCRWIYSSKQRKNVRLELLSHIEESVERKCERGVSRDSAVESVLHEMGPAKSLAYQLGYTHRPMIFKGSFLMAAFTVLFVIALGSALESTSRSFKNMSLKQSKIIDSYLNRFLEDQELLSADPLFDFPGHLHDAGPTLNQKIKWMGDGRGDFAQFFPKQVPLDISEKFVDKIRGANWLDTQVNLSEYDTKWMASLSQFDHWDFFDSGPISRMFEADASRNFWGLPIPNYSILQTWIKIRLLQGLKEKKPMAALREAHQLARLIYSTQLLVSSMIYIALLDNERVYFEKALELGLVTREMWKTITPDEYIRARRALFAFPGMFDLWTDPKTTASIFDGQTAKAGMCSAIEERLFGLSVSRLFYQGNPFFSGDLDSKFRQVDKILEQSRSNCVISRHLINIWNHPNLAAPWMSPRSYEMTEAGYREKMKWFILARLPIVKTWIGAEFDEIARPSYITGPYTKYVLAGEKKIE